MMVWKRLNHKKQEKKCPECGEILLLEKEDLENLWPAQYHPECKYVKADENKINEETGDMSLNGFL